MGVVFKPSPLAFGISIGAKQAGEGAELSDNGNIRLYLPLEKTATTEEEGKIPSHWMTIVLFWGAQEEGSQPNSSGGRLF